MSWTFFPIYNLKISEPNAWINEPLFTDATLVSRSALQKVLDDNLEPGAAPLIGQRKLSEVLGREKVASMGVGVPYDHLVEIEPTSYIAVRDKGDKTRNHRRATEIRALLSATLALRARIPRAVPSRPHSVIWRITSGEVSLTAEGATTNLTPELNDHVLIKPLDVKQSDIRKSLKDGSTIPNNQGFEWDMKESLPVCQVILAPKGKFQIRLLNAALLIQEAACAPTYESQIVLAVSALEALLKPKSFDDLRAKVSAFIGEGYNPEEVEKILSMRHRIAHEGRQGEDHNTFQKTALDALVYGWQMLDIATAFELGNSSRMSFDDYLDLLTACQCLDVKTSRFGGEFSESIEKAVHDKIPDFRKYLSGRYTFKA